MISYSFQVATKMEENRKCEKNSIKFWNIGKGCTYKYLKIKILKIKIELIITSK